MNVAHPLRGIIPTLDAPVIEALAATTRPLTGREVNRLAGVGSPRGVQLVLRRLVAQGLVLAEGRDNAGYDLANRWTSHGQAFASAYAPRHALLHDPADARSTTGLRHVRFGAAPASGLPQWPL